VRSYSPDILIGGSRKRVLNVSEGIIEGTSSVVMFGLRPGTRSTGRRARGVCATADGANAVHDEHEH
jgi:hypothetical protein